MTKSKKHPIRDGVAVAVLAALIIWLASFVPGLFGWMSERVIAVGKVIRTPIALPAWFLVVLAALAGAAIVRFFRWIIPRREERGATWRDYTADTFLGLEWHWRYNAIAGGITGLHARCPADKTVMVWSMDQFRGLPLLLCETCGSKSGVFDESGEEVKNKIIRQIERKIFTGEYRAVVERYELNKLPR